MSVYALCKGCYGLCNQKILVHGFLEYLFGLSQSMAILEYLSRISQSMDLWNIYLDYVSLCPMAIMEYLEYLSLWLLWNI